MVQNIRKTLLALNIFSIYSMQNNSIKQIENKNNIINPNTQNTNIDISNTNKNTININTISDNYNE